MDAAFACVTRGDRELAAPTDAAPFAALTGASDPTFVEASHVVDPATRVATVTLRCRPQPATNAPAAPAAAATLAGTLTVATSGPARFADGAPGVVVELGGGSPHNSWDHAGSRFGRGRGGSGGAGRSGERAALSARRSRRGIWFGGGARARARRRRSTSSSARSRSGAWRCAPW